MTARAPPLVGIFAPLVLCRLDVARGSPRVSVPVSASLGDIVINRIRSRASRASSGFTLIELMVVVAIIAILAAIGIPIYRDYLIRGYLTEVQAGLSAVRTAQEQFYQDNRSYKPASGGCGAKMPASKQWTYTCSPSNDGQSWSATAGGNTGTAVKDFQFTIDQTNTRKTNSVKSGWKQPTENCWVVRKDGSCS